MWVVGRKGDETVVAGRAVVVSEVWAAVEELPELSDGLFQIVRHSPTMERLRLRVGYAPERTTDLAELELRLGRTSTAGSRCRATSSWLRWTSCSSRTSSVAKFPRVVKK